MNDQDTDEAAEYKRWALALHHETYTIQVCLKICLQLYTIKGEFVSSKIRILSGLFPLQCASAGPAQHLLRRLLTSMNAPLVAQKEERNVSIW
jgi:hypothetical protein